MRLIANTASSLLSRILKSRLHAFITYAKTAQSSAQCFTSCSFAKVGFFGMWEYRGRAGFCRAIRRHCPHAPACATACIDSRRLRMDVRASTTPNPKALPPWAQLRRISCCPGDNRRVPMTLDAQCRTSTNSVRQKSGVSYLQSGTGESMLWTATRISVARDRA